MMPAQMLAACLAICSLGQQPGQGGPGIHAAVVNVATVSERYLRTAELEGQFDAQRQRFQEDASAMRDEIEKKGRALQEQLKPGTEAYAQKREELAMLEARLQYFGESTKRSMESELANALRSIYDDIAGVVRELAEEKGLDLVLTAEDLPASVPPTPKLATQEILWRKVVYWSPGIDITAEVVARLNAHYAARPADQPAAAEPAGTP